MDARSIAATAANKGFLTAADEFTGTYTKPAYHSTRRFTRTVSSTARVWQIRL